MKTPMKTPLKASEKNVAYNHRAALEKLAPKCTAKYSDEELLAVIHYWDGMSTPEEQFEAVRYDVSGSTKRPATAG